MKKSLLIAIGSFMFGMFTSGFMFYRIMQATISERNRKKSLNRIKYRI